MYVQFTDTVVEKTLSHFMKFYFREFWKCHSCQLNCSFVFIISHTRTERSRKSLHTNIHRYTRTNTLKSHTHTFSTTHIHIFVYHLIWITVNSFKQSLTHTHTRTRTQTAQSCWKTNKFSRLQPKIREMKIVESAEIPGCNKTQNKEPYNRRWISLI